MRDPEEQFENLLREFEAVRPRALPQVLDPHIYYWGRFAAAAVLLLSCALSAWLVWHGQSSANPSQRAALPLQSAEPSPPRHLSLISWTQLALRDPQSLDKELDAQSRIVLPRFDLPQSTLRVLAKE
jgi:hypothetical protein